MSYVRWESVEASWLNNSLGQSVWLNRAAKGRGGEVPVRAVHAKLCAQFVVVGQHIKSNSICIRSEWIIIDNMRCRSLCTGVSSRQGRGTDICRERERGRLHWTAKPSATGGRRCVWQVDVILRWSFEARPFEAFALARAAAEAVAQNWANSSNLSSTESGLGGWWRRGVGKQRQLLCE